MAQLVKRWTLGFSSSHNLMVCEFEPHVGDSLLSLSLSLSLSHFLSLRYWREGAVTAHGSQDVTPLGWDLIQLKVPSDFTLLIKTFSFYLVFEV